MINLISINGKIKSGKDTVTELIQKHSTLDFENRKFAESLKIFTATLIGCHRDLLEDQDFKASSLSPIWNYEVLETIGYNHGGRLRGLCIKEMTVRDLLIRIGDGMRNVVHPDIWINSLFVNYLPFPKGKIHPRVDFSELYSHRECKGCRKSYSGYKHQYLCKECIEDDSIQFLPNWLISDMRYLNEVKKVEKENGITIRINRENIPHLDHISETALDEYKKFTYTIDNNGTLQDLEKQVIFILEDLKIKK